jgi:endonuclease V-like protein UPF0215 family
MLTAITHHRFSSPIWGQHELRQLNAELAELDALAYQVVIDHRATGPDDAERARRATFLVASMPRAVRAAKLASRA